MEVRLSLVQGCEKFHRKKTFLVTRPGEAAVAPVAAVDFLGEAVFLGVDSVAAFLAGLEAGLDPPLAFETTCLREGLARGDPRLLRGVDFPLGCCCLFFIASLQQIPFQRKVDVIVTSSTFFNAKLM